MPIIDIEAVCAEPTEFGPETIRKIADAVGEAFQLAPGKVWVRLHTLPKSAYAESGTDVGQTPDPVFVRVLRSRVPTGEDLEREIIAATRIVASCLGRREQNVHVEYAPPGLGRMAFGGKLSR
ncbi:MAG: hypothetical protein JNM33_06755 [Rubrivivax sp.]|nr:hypothetical protein [Rubrivivax sp.]